MCTSRVIWERNSQKYHSEVDDYISDAQFWHNDIASERDKAERQAANPKWRKPGVFNELSDLLDDAERFLANRKHGKPTFRQKWEGILDDAQSWNGNNLRRIHGQIRQFIRRLRDCQSEAAQLKQLVDKTRCELSL